MSLESKSKIKTDLFINLNQEVTMKLLFRKVYYQEIIPFKNKIRKIMKLIMGKDDDPFGNSCLIL